MSAGQLHRRPAAPAEKQEQGQKPEGRRAWDAGLTEPTAAFSVSFLFAIWIASLQAGGLSKTTDARLPAAMTTPPANPSMSMLPDAPSLMSALAAAAAVPAAAGVAAAGGSLAAVAAAGEEKLRPVRAAARNAAGAERRAPTLLTLTTPPRSRGANMMAADLCNRECQTQGPGPLAGAAAGRAEEAAPGGFSASSESARLLVGPAGCGVSSHDSARDTSLLVRESLGCWSLWSFGYAAGWELYVALGGTLRGQPTSARAGAPCYTSSYHASYSRSKLTAVCKLAPWRRVISQRAGSRNSSRGCAAAGRFLLFELSLSLYYMYTRDNGVVIGLFRQFRLDLQTCFDVLAVRSEVQTQG